jgi:pyridoxal phosphate enzyme (YggS family)
VIAARLAALEERIERAAGRAGRDPGEVTLMGVSKTRSADEVREAFDAGLREFGENRVQEAEAKIEALADLRRDGLRCHLIGHLQKNKARRAAALFDSVHSLDGVALARRLAAAALEAGRSPLKALLQADLAGEETKHGLADTRLEEALTALAGLDGLRVAGLMLLPPLLEDLEGVRPYFARLRERRDALNAAGLLPGRELSMGMSHDFEVAVEEGATCVRLGTALFGPRD